MTTRTYDCVDLVARETADEARRNADAALAVLEEVRELAGEFVALRAAVSTATDRVIQIDQRVSHRLDLLRGYVPHRDERDERDTDPPPRRVRSWIDRWMGRNVRRGLGLVTASALGAAGQAILQYLLHH